MALPYNKNTKRAVLGMPQTSDCGGSEIIVPLQRDYITFFLNRLFTLFIFNR